MARSPVQRRCGRIAAQQQMVDQILSLALGTRVSVLAPIVRGRKGEYQKELLSLRQKGFVRVRVDGEIRDLSEAVRVAVAQRALSVPAQVPTDAITLTDERRHRVPMTVLMGTASADEISSLLEDPPPWAAELAASEHLSIVEIDSGHWPQFSVPDELARMLIAAIRED